MGCSHSKKKSKGKKGEKKQKHSRQDDGGKCQSDEQDVYLEKQLERFEWQLRILKAVLSANGNLERAELLKHHADEEVCALVLSILDKVRTETTADLNVLHEQKSKTAAEEHDRILEELQKRQDQEKTALTQRFQAAEDVLKDKVEELTSDLQFYNQLKRRVESSTFKKDLQKNLQTHGRPGEFWESEQESLLYVIELRNECVQEQNRKLRYMDALVEKNLALEDQISHVLQQKEDLREQLDSCQAVIQQLLEETKDLKVELESHVIINQKLTQEKEQLMFRLRNPDLCPTTLLPGVVQELAPR